MTAHLLSIGDFAPDFTVQSTAGDVTLSVLRPKMVVLYFYPKDDTPGCTIEAIDFTARADDFSAAGVTVLGLSRDSVLSHDKFCKKHNLNVTLLSDEDGTVCAHYGVWVEKQNYGKTYMGIERTTVLIDGSGKILNIWRKVTAKGHVDEVLAAVRAL